MAPIRALITTNGISKEVYIQCAVAPEKWSQAKERAIGRDKLCEQVNFCLDNFRIKVIGIRMELISKGYEGNSIEIKDRLLSSYSSSRMFLNEFEQYCQKRQGEVGIQITQLTANKYHRLLRYMREYIK